MQSLCLHFYVVVEKMLEIKKEDMIYDRGRGDCRTQ